MAEETRHWWVGKSDERLGPYSLTTLQQLIVNGKVDADDLVWQRGYESWQRVRDIEELANFSSHREHRSPASTTPKSNQSVSDGQDSVDRDGKTAKRSPARGASKADNGPYLLRHWRGQLSLPLSFWVNNYGLTALIIFTVSIVISDFAFVDSRGEIAALLVFFILLFATTVWQIVGVWRSAENHIAGGGSGFWGRTAQALCILGAFSAAGQYLQVSDTYTEYVRIVFGADDYSDYELRLLEGGTDIEISGAIGFGLADQLEDMLDGNPRVSVVHLNSHGGRIAEARRIREVISQPWRGLNTYTSTECLSACTIAFLGGSRRFLNESARLGFHRYQFPGLSDTDFEDAINVEREYMLGQGIQASFVSKATHALADDMWFPSNAELIKSGFVHEISLAQEFARSGTPVGNDGDGQADDLVAQMEREWESNELFRVFRLVEQDSPGIKAQFLQIARNAQQNGESWEEAYLKANELGRQFGAEQAMQYFGRAQDKVLLAAIRIFTNVLEQMLSEPGDACYTWMFGGAATPHSYSDSQIAELMVVMGDLVESAIVDPAPTLNALESDLALEELISLFEKREGAEALQDLALMADTVDTLVERRRVCKVAIALYETALAMDSQDGANVLRVLFNEGG